LGEGRLERVVDPAECRRRHVRVFGDLVRELDQGRKIRAFPAGFAVKLVGQRVYAQSECDRVAEGGHPSSFLRSL
jgi:hypothetical protein